MVQFAPLLIFGPATKEIEDRRCSIESGLGFKLSNSLGVSERFPRSFPQHSTKVTTSG
jgi:hypothetical protein